MRAFTLAFLIAGVLSSFGELEHMHTGKADFLPFDPETKQPKMSYKVSARNCGMPALQLTQASRIPIPLQVSARSWC